MSLTTEPPLPPWRTPLPWRLGPGLTLSLLLHAGLLAWLLMTYTPKPMPSGAPEEGVPVVFEATPEGPPLPQQEPPPAAPEAAGTEAPLAPPQPEAPPAPPEP
ncbi:hypothetical protein NON00_13845, partial [Roseomonas sp. GC11]|nr:hypothetical protein [Roseomonas sp. GC11]